MLLKEGISSWNIAGKSFWKNFLKGYSEESNFDEHSIQHIPTFLKLKEVYMFSEFMKGWWEIENKPKDVSEYMYSALRNIERGTSLIDFDFNI